MSNINSTPIPGQNVPSVQDLISNLPSSIAELTPEELQQLSDLLNLSSVSTSKQEKDLLSVLAMMPSPWISPMVINQIFQDPKNVIGLQGALDAITGMKLNQAENSIILAGLAAWLKSQEIDAQRAKEAMLRAPPDQSLNVALKSYVESQGKGAIDPIQMLQFLRTNPVLVSALQSVDPDVLTKALHISESQIVIQMLDKMIADQAIANRIAQRQAIQTDIRTSSERDNQIRQQIVKDYVDEIQRKKEETGKTDTSMLAMMLVQAVTIPFWAGVITAPTASFPTEEISKTMQAIASMAPEEMKVSMQMLSQAASQMACYFCIPVLVTMMGNNTDLPEKEISIKTVRAYVLTLISMLASKDFDALLSQVALKNVANPASITEERLKSWIAVMKVALLVNCLAALEKIEIGHLNADGLMSMLLGNTAIPPNDYLRALIVKLFNEQYELIPESERETFLANVCAYYEKNPEVESLINPGKSFMALCNPRFFRETAQAQSV